MAAIIWLVAPLIAVAAVGSGLLAAWGAPALALGHEGVRARDVRLGLLPALWMRFVRGGAW